jgi:hypothetical protein
MADERVGTAQRTEVLELLNRALEEGYLSLDEYEQRMRATSDAQTMSQLHTQLRDLPRQFHWYPGAQRTPIGRPQRPAADRNVRAFAVTALSLGIASIPLSICMVGGLFGIAAIFFSFPGSRGASGWSMALIGRILGIIGVILSLGVLALVIFSPSDSA